MALGVEAAGVVAETGGAVAGVAAGGRVMAHSLPLRFQGTWAECFVTAATDAAPVPDAVPFEVAAALPVPALSADQALRDALGVAPGATVLVNGAGGVTGTRATGKPPSGGHQAVRLCLTVGACPPGSGPPVRTP